MSASTTADAAPRPSPTVGSRPRKWLASLGVALGGALVFMLVLIAGVGASMGPATVGLVIAAGALVFCLHSLYRMVQALAVPETLVEAARDVDALVVDRRELREERRRLLRAINELRFDFEMGKLSEADYREVREAYELRAVEVMRALDGGGELHPRVVELLKDAGVSVPAPTDDQAPSEAGPSEAARTEADASAGPIPGDAGPIDAGPMGADADASTQPEEPVASSTPTCSACGASNDHDARFCKRCGTELKA